MLRVLNPFLMCIISDETFALATVAVDNAAIVGSNIVGRTFEYIHF